jgi:hypothetical protein
MRGHILIKKVDSCAAFQGENIFLFYQWQDPEKAVQLFYKKWYL